ncbi:MAG: alpha/beta hydrolase [Candidatus Coatesbacteria bacterium]|nr:alpha/beta hydrolase [Candidatus Coatesbacteria bacterium]
MKILVILLISLLIAGCKKKDSGQPKKVEKIEDKKEIVAKKELPGEFKVKAGDLEISARLAIPENLKNPCPVLFIIPDKPPKDKDNTLSVEGLVAKSYRDLTIELNKSGIAVATYDSRPFILQKKGGMYSNVSFSRNYEDAKAVFEEIKKSKNIDPENIYILGHRLGGQFAIRLAAENENLAGLILFNFDPNPIEKQVSAEIDKRIEEQTALMNKTAISDQKQVFETNIATLKYNKDKFMRDFLSIKQRKEDLILMSFGKDWWFEASNWTNDYPNVLRKIKSPVSLICIELKKENEPVFARIFPNSRLEVLKNTDENMLVPENSEISQEFVKALLPHLKR